MKLFKTLLIFGLLAVLLLPSTALAKEAFDDKVVFGGTFTLEQGETHQGNLVVFGGAVTIEYDSTVYGDVVLMGGTVEVSGSVEGNVVGIGGAVRLNEGADINGDVFTLGAALRREDGVSVRGQIVDGLDIPEDWGGNEVVPPTPPTVNFNPNPILEIIWFFFRVFMYAALAVLLVMFLPAHVERVREAALTQPVITAGAGLLTAILAPLALIAITITIVLIPVTLVAILLLFAAWLIGWVALGTEVGRRLAKALSIELAPAISAGIGTLILLFVLGGFRTLVPCIGWIPQTLIGLWGLGAVLMTRFGTQAYIPETDQPSGKPDLIDANVQNDASAEREVEKEADESSVQPNDTGDETGAS